MTPGQDDFTADVIVALVHPSGTGLYIPRHNEWDHAHPQEHTRLVLEAIRRTQVSYARVVRLVKHWARNHDKPLCSWHIKVIALDAVTAPTTLLGGLVAWFDEAITAVSTGPSEDPAGVCRPLTPAAGKAEALRTLRTASAHLTEAIALQDEGLGSAALDELAQVFDDEAVLPRPDPHLVREDYAERLRKSKAGRPSRAATTTPVAGHVAGMGAGQRDFHRSWAAAGATAPAAPSALQSLVTPSGIREASLLSAAGPGPAALRRAVGAGQPCRSDAARPSWFGADPAWRYPFERAARRRYGRDLHVEPDVLAGRLTYRVTLDVPGYPEPALSRVVFAARPWWELYGLYPQEFTLVFADAAQQLSPHRMPSGALCLYEPYAPPQNRWTDDEGLDALLEMTRTHVFAERHWRAGVTRRGRFRDGEWLLPEAPHGLPRPA